MSQYALADVRFAPATGEVTPVWGNAPSSWDGDVVVVALEDLQVGPVPRDGGLNQAHVAVLAELDGQWPPILVARADHRVIDGHHRVAAAKVLGLREMRVRLFDGRPEDAFLEFVRCNVAHGLPLTLRERKSAAGRILAANPQWSDRRIARLCALSPATVGRIRPQEGEHGSGGARLQSAKADARIGLDGRTWSPPRDGVRAQIVALLNERPQSSLRTVARAVSVSPETVRSVRNSLKSEETGTGCPPADGPTVRESPQPMVRRMLDVIDRPRSEPVPWQSDSAIASHEHGPTFLAWFDRTAIEMGDCRRHLDEVPLSRIYVVADEARKRAACWSSFASSLEGRAGRSSH